MNVTLSYPTYPHSVTFTRQQFEALLFADTGDEDYPALVNWLVEREGGPVLITTISADPDLPFERPEIALPDTSDVESWEMEDMLKRNYHIGRGTSYSELELGFVRLSFANRDTALLFKLTFGGAA